MELTLGSINLLRHVISVDGKKEINGEGKDIDSPRRLNGEESAQRRFFIKEADRVNAETKDAFEAMVKPYNDLVSATRDAWVLTNPKQEGEEDRSYDLRAQVAVSKDAEVSKMFEELNGKNAEFIKKSYAVTLSEKTLDFLKKYFKTFGDEVGFMQGDDASVEELTEKLA